jgi:hypothetical protein
MFEIYWKVNELHPCHMKKRPATTMVKSALIFQV